MKKPELKINSFGTKYWFLNGKLHRVDGPAIEYENGSKEWFLNGKLHRDDGPAIEDSNGKKCWYLNGKKVKEEDVIINAYLTEREYIKFVINQ
ncbi:MAG TPA: hypothetical protein VMZ91_12415 [Candidatus Paceibacterota bacterium]|nr:hypothetical protein [Candidatus Paceibacterota bacterium]